MSDARTRRHRRQAKQAIKFGAKAKPSHKLKAGRTGMKHAKREPSKQPSGITTTSTAFAVPRSSWWITE